MAHVTVMGTIIKSNSLHQVTWVRGEYGRFEMDLCESGFLCCITFFGETLELRR